jgi:hypothetical protein
MDQKPEAAKRPHFRQKRQSPVLPVRVQGREDFLARLDFNPVTGVKIKDFPEFSHQPRSWQSPLSATMEASQREA